MIKLSASGRLLLSHSSHTVPQNSCCFVALFWTEWPKLLTVLWNFVICVLSHKNLPPRWRFKGTASWDFSKLLACMNRSKANQESLSTCLLIFRSLRRFLVVITIFGAAQLWEESGFFIDCGLVLVNFTSLLLVDVHENIVPRPFLPALRVHLVNYQILYTPLSLRQKLKAISAFLVVEQLFSTCFYVVMIDINIVIKVISLFAVRYWASCKNFNYCIKSKQTSKKESKKFYLWDWHGLAEDR